jgi:hypothetical protein
MYIPKKYIPQNLTQNDYLVQIKQINKSRKLYKKGKYFTRKKLKSFISKQSPHIIRAKKMYKLDNFKVDNRLVNATKCTKSSLNQIVKKGQGAYYSSGSRPNQTAHSWGYARLASTITGGPAVKNDYNILANGCQKTSNALSLAKQ